VSATQAGFEPPSISTVTRTVACTTPPFNDVPVSNPFCPWIQELVNRGITSGCGGGNYCPGNPVTRGQMAVFLSATFGLPVPVP